MTVTQFKLTSSEGITRRLKFTDPPSWPLLAERIEALFGIPLERIGASYIDNDGDEVTLSSEGELQDYYETSHQPDQVIKFAVHDLAAYSTAQTDPDKPLPETPRTSAAPSGVDRNTFGGPSVRPFAMETDEDWERIPGLGGLGGLGLGVGLGSMGMFMPDDKDSSRNSPHAFLVEVDSETASKTSEAARENSYSATSLTETEASRPRDDRGKGKGKARGEMLFDVEEDDDASTASVIGNETPVKLPVHVYDVSDAEGDITDSAQIFGRTRSNSAASRTQSTTSSSTAKAAAPRVATPEDIAPDPPLADMPAEEVRVSLTNDVASFLNTMSSVLSTHPELTNGLSNIMRHARDGSYWNAQRDAINRATEQLRRSSLDVQAEAGRAGEYMRRAAEEEAGRRVTQAVNNIAQAVRQVTDGIGSNNQPPVTSTPIDQQTFAMPPSGPPRPFTPPSPPTREWMPPPISSLDTAFTPGLMNDTARPPPPPPPPPPPHSTHPPHHPPHQPPHQPPHPPHHPHHRHAFPPHFHRPYHHFPPPPPPHLLHRPMPPTPPSFPSFTHAFRGMDPPPPPGFVPTGNSFMTSFFGPLSSDAPPSPGDMHGSSDYQDIDLYGMHPRWGPPRAELDAAKNFYKATKERYRSERDERRRRRGRMDPSGDSTMPLTEADVSRNTVDPQYMSGAAQASGGPSTDAALDVPPQPVPGPSGVAEPLVTQIVSNPRGGFPGLEMFSVPRRHNTFNGHGHGHGRHGRGGGRGDRAGSISAEDPERIRTMQERVERRVTEMGFSDPTLTRRVSAHLRPREGTADNMQVDEQNVVMNVVDELLEAPQPSGSGVRNDEDVPGAWR